MLENKGKTLEYHTTDALPLKYRFFGDESASEAVVYVNGLESHGEWFADVADFLGRSGYAVYLWDRRGSGLNETGRGDCESYRLLVDDLAIFIENLRKKHARIHLVGHSWGGKFATYFTVRRQILVDSLALISPGLAPKVGYRLPTKFRIALAYLMKRKTARFTTPIKTEMFTSDPRALEYIGADPLRLKKITARFLVENLKMDMFLRQNADGVRVPTALFLAGDDKVVDNTLVRSTFGRFNPYLRRTREWRGAKHCLLFERPDEIKIELLAWLRDCLNYSISPRRILVAGAGGVGCVVGGLLAMSGHYVTLLARPRHAKAIRADGLKMTLFGIERTVKNIAAVTDGAGAEPADVVIMCAKSFDTETVAREIKPFVNEDTILLSIQNGIGNEETLRLAYPRNAVAGGVILGYFAMVADGHCESKNDRGGILIAPFAKMNPAQLRELADVLRDSRIIVRTAPDCRGVKWSKLLLNAPFNALSAVTDLPVEKIRADKRLFALNRRLFRECLAVMRKEKIPVYDFPGYGVKHLAAAACVPNFIAFRLHRISTSEQGGRSSMWYDVTAGRGRTEIDWMNGAVVAEAKKCGLSAPANESVTKIVKEIASDAEARARYAHNPSLVCKVAKSK